MKAASRHVMDACFQDFKDIWLQYQHEKSMLFVIICIHMWGPGSVLGTSEGQGEGHMCMESSTIPVMGFSLVSLSIGPLFETHALRRKLCTNRYDIIRSPSRGVVLTISS